MGENSPVASSFALLARKCTDVQSTREDNRTEKNLKEKRRELVEVQCALEAFKELHELRMEELGKRRKAIEAKYRAHQVYRARMKRHVQDSIVRKTAALARAREQRLVVIQKDLRIGELRWQIVKLCLRRRETLQRVKRHDGVRRFVQRIIEENAVFPGFQEMVHRHHSLLFTRRELLMDDRQAEREIHTWKQGLIAFLEEKEVEQIRFNNFITEQRAKLEDAKRKASRLKAAWDSKAWSSASCAMTIAYVRLVTRNLYKRIINLQGGTAPGTDTFSHQLEYIAYFFETHRFEHAEEEKREEGAHGGSALTDGHWTNRSVKRVSIKVHPQPKVAGALSPRGTKIQRRDVRLQ